MAGSLRRFGVAFAGVAVAAALVATTGGAAGAKVLNPVITNLMASPSTVTTSDGTVTISATVANASTCTLLSSIPLNGLPQTSDCSSGSFTETVVIPLDSGRRALKYKFTLTATGATSKSKKVKVIADAGAGHPLLANVASVIGDDHGYCALLTTARVDCWGHGGHGELGNGSYSNSALPVVVEGVGGTGMLGGVTRLARSQYGYCALLTSGGVACWGFDNAGQLGNGQTNFDSAFPVAVEGIGGSGALSGVTQLVGTGDSYCAVLTSGGVDCWGGDSDGHHVLGDGSGPVVSSTPVAVEGVGGSGTLSGVKSVVGDGGGTYVSGYCALLTSGGVDCWGLGLYGELGNGSFSDSTVPVAVVGVGGSGTLGSVASVVSDSLDNCALLTSGSVDCWGYDYRGNLGNGVGGTGAEYAVPVPVLGIGGSGTLTGVTSLVSDQGIDPNGYCALLSSGGVACWGDNSYGDLGNGSGLTYIPFPVAAGVGGVASLEGGDSSYCARLTSGGADCWGFNSRGELGNGSFTNSATPGPVDGVGGSGTLGGVTGLVSDGTLGNSEQQYCGVLTSGGVDCWGGGSDGELGDGVFYTTGIEASSTPVEVLSP